MPASEFEKKRDTISLRGACEMYRVSRDTLMALIDLHGVRYSQGFKGVEIDVEDLAIAMRKERGLPPKK